MDPNLTATMVKTGMIYASSILIYAFVGYGFYLLNHHVRIFVMVYAYKLNVKQTLRL